MIRKTIIFPIAILAILLVPFSVGLGQTGSVSGVVTDSLTGQPLVNLTVFIPSTTKGTTTDQNGKYLLDRLSPGDYSLMYRHLGYPSVSRDVTIEAGKQIVLNLVIAEELRKLKEVTVYGKVPDPRMGYHLFKQFFLGDATEKFCYLENPDDLTFHFEDNSLMVVARKPLIIVNRHLGYRVTFFLDYFRCGDTGKPEFNYYDIGYFGYSGSAFFADLTASVPLRKVGWMINRSGEFKGSLKHFLASLYQDELTDNKYYIRRAYSGLREIQMAEKQSNAMTKIKMAQMDSLSAWNHVTGKADVLHYYPYTEFRLTGVPAQNGSDQEVKSISADAFLLVFRDYLNTRDLSDDFISTLRIPKGGIGFDKDGNLWTNQGELQWVNLDNTLQVKRLLPFDYMPKRKEDR